MLCGGGFMTAISAIAMMFPVNQNPKSFFGLAFVFFSGLLIIWLASMSRKAEDKMEEEGL